MANAKDIKNKIKSVKNTQNIAKAMEMISAVKMRKAQQATLKTRSYAENALELLAKLKKKVHTPHQLMKEQKGSVLALIIASDKGLCGGFNTSVLKKANNLTKEIKIEIDFITIGKRAANWVARTNHHLVADFSENIGNQLSIYDIYPLTHTIIDAFTSGKYSEVRIISNKYISAISYQSIARKLLPISDKSLNKQSTEIETMEHKQKKTSHIHNDTYTFEPDEDSVLDTILPRLVEMQVYQAILESHSAEHSARMIAMKNAKDNAKEMADNLTMSYNKARQAGVTQEIGEIAAGAEAMKYK